MTELMRVKWMDFITDALLMGYVIPHLGADPNPCFGIDEGTKWRWILSLKRKNQFMRKIHTKMLTVKRLGQMIPRGAWCVTGDYKKFFWQFLVHWAEALRQGFEITEADVEWYMTKGPIDFVRRMNELHPGRFPTRFCFPVVVMGGAQSQQKTTPYVRRLVQSSNEVGIPTESFADEWIAFHVKRKLAYLLSTINFGRDHLMGLGYTWEKTIVFPTQTPEFIGWEWCTRLLRLRPRWARVEDMRLVAATIIQKHAEGKEVTPREKARIQGKVIGARAGIREAGLRVRESIEDLTRDLRRSGQDYDVEVPITDALVALCKWIGVWTNHELWGYFRLETPTVTLTSDASPWAWSGHTNPPTWTMRGTFTAELLGVHHNEQEEEAGDRTTEGYLESTGLAGTPVAPIYFAREQDNRTVIKVVSANMCRSVSICRRRLRHLQYLDFRSVQEVPVFISGKVMDNLRLADKGSRERTA
jgi:hypothetical protein